jgi:hypothetical protein
MEYNIAIKHESCTAKRGLFTCYILCPRPVLTRRHGAEKDARQGRRHLKHGGGVPCVRDLSKSEPGCLPRQRNHCHAAQNLGRCSISTFSIGRAHELMPRLAGTPCPRTLPSKPLSVYLERSSTGKRSWNDYLELNTSRWNLLVSGAKTCVGIRPSPAAGTHSEYPHTSPSDTRTRSCPIHRKYS